MSLALGIIQQAGLGAQAGGGGPAHGAAPGALEHQVQEGGGGREQERWVGCAGISLQGTILLC